MREAARQTVEMRPVCKSLWMAWILPTSDLMLISLHACWASLLTCCRTQQLSSPVAKRRLLPGAWGTESSVVPVYQLSENLHFNWILTCEPNYTFWITGAPSEKQVRDLKCESTEDDRQSNKFIDDAEFNLMCQDCSWSHHQENPLIVCVCVSVRVWERDRERDCVF